MVAAQQIVREPAQATPDARPVALWLLACCVLIFAIVVIGGITRLTESGLSIVRWEPVGGIVPPLSAEDWQRLFALYRDSPQGRLNPAMALADFQAIFWWEYVHRLWGRLIGLVFLVPFLWFLATGRIARRWRWPLAGLFVLGGLQGALGWWMVASGLRDVPWVSPYRLAAHLGLALLIYGATLWLALEMLGWRCRTRRGGTLPRLAGLAVGLVLLTVLSGAFVAGTDAGLIYNEFPWMGGGLVPPDYRDPGLGLLANSFENHAAVQFHHRVLAVATVLHALVLWARVRGVADAPARRLGHALAVLALVQAGSGITTLLLQVPVFWGALHQAGAVSLLTVALLLAFRVAPSAGAG